MSIRPARPDRPSSPWATRFPFINTTYERGGANHSALAPLCPNIGDPRYYAYLSADPSQPRSEAELDTVMWHEETQSRKLHGLKTWEASALHEKLLFSSATGLVPGGHVPEDRGLAEASAWAAYAREGLQVDESKWLPVLRKRKWFDWVEGPPLGSPARAGRVWSVDDPVIWNALRTPLELVNRMLNAMIEDKQEWFEAIIWGRIDDWDAVKDNFNRPALPTGVKTSKGLRVILSRSSEARIAMEQNLPQNPWEEITRKSPDEWRKRLGKLLEFTLWGFLNLWETDRAHAITSIPDPGTEALTEYTNIITLSLELVGKLTDTNLTLAELCSYQVYVAMTMIHELVHAILRVRVEEEGYSGNAWDKTIDKNKDMEPFFDANGTAEAGYMAESLFFGGLMECLPSNMRRIVKGVPATWENRLALAIEEYPSPRNNTNSVPGPYTRDAGALTTVYHLTSFWFSKMLSEEFWTAESPRQKSDNFFWRTPILVGRSPNKKAGAPPVEWVSPELRHPDVINATNGWVDWHEEQTYESLQDRRDHWDLMRVNWYPSQSRAWKKSPWAIWGMRDRYRPFAQAYVKRDETACFAMANSLVRSMPWRNKQRYYEALPKQGALVGFYWVWHCLGLLMMASLPTRLEDLKIVNDTTAVVTFSPSEEAAKFGLTSPFSCSYLYNDEDSMWSFSRDAPTSQFYQDLPAHLSTNPVWGGMPAEDIDQKDHYLQRVQDILDQIKRDGAMVHQKWFDALCRGAREVMAARDALDRQYPDAHQTKWCPTWDFEIPEFDASVVTFDSANDTWNHVAIDWSAATPV